MTGVEELLLMILLALCSTPANANTASAFDAAVNSVEAEAPLAVLQALLSYPGDPQQSLRAAT
jgi:hypothetical protein